MARATSETLLGQVAIVTGGSAGIGFAMGVALATRRARAVLVGRDPGRLESAVAQVRRQVADADVTGLALDVSRGADMQRMSEFTLEKHGRIDILVACAGVLRPSSGRIAMVRDTSVEDWDEVSAINLKGVFLSNRAVLPTMYLQRRGQIVNVASTSGLRGHAFDATYCATKFAVVGLTEALAEEVRAHGVRVQALLPGATESAIWTQNGPIPKPQQILPVERLVRSAMFMLELPADAEIPRLTVEPQPDGNSWRRPAVAACLHT